MSQAKANILAASRKLTRRALFLGGAQVAFLAGLGARMYSLQVEQADSYRLLAEENRISDRLIPPARGQIYDRSGVEIAVNIPSYRIVVIREETDDLDQVLGRLGQIVALDPEELKEARKDMVRLRGDTPVTVADRVSWETVSRVAANAPALPGVVPELGLSRNYPFGPDFAHIVGYVGPVSDSDLERVNAPRQLLSIPRFQVGKFGLEAQRDDALRGRAGVKRVEVNATNRVMRELERKEGQRGADIQITTDHALQRYLHARLAGESAAAVVMDCRNGDILASASAPSFDPNLFVHGISSREYSGLLENKYRPLPNKAIQGIYPPGSTFKMVTALAALEAGTITPSDTVHCPGHLEVSGRRFHCWKRAGHGGVNLHRSLRESCDVYYYTIALKTGIEKISEMARKLGLGERYDLPLTSVAQGLAPTKAWKKQAKGVDWFIGDTVNACIGQGFVLASPLQLAVMTARIATGRNIVPRLIKSIDGVDAPLIDGEDLALNPANLKSIREAMFAVSNSSRGTAYRSRIIENGYQLSGKTGTSQVRSTVVKNSEVPWEERDHALFVNFAPSENPNIAVSVIVEHGGGGSKAAAPVARDITLQALYGGYPPLSAYPSQDRSKIKEQQKKFKQPPEETTETVSDRA